MPMFRVETSRSNWSQRYILSVAIWRWAARLIVAGGFGGIGLRVHRVYGLSLNWEKTEVLPIGCDADIQGPNGEPIKSKTSVVYLGRVISAMAKADFDALNRVWKHAHLVRYKSSRLVWFPACCILFIQFWLCRADWRKIDAFQARCFRSILGILLMDEILHRFSSTTHPFPTLNLSIDAKPLLKKACRRMDEILHHVSASSTLTLEG